MSDTITLKGMAFYGYHGVLPEEKTLGQRFLVDATLHLDLRPAGQTDDLAITVDYTRVYATVKTLVEEGRHNLIESLAEKIAGAVLTGFPAVDQVQITVTKPEVPIPGILAGVRVQIARSRR